MAQAHAPYRTSLRDVPAAPTEGTDPVESYPSLRRAAALAGVSASTLSRRKDVIRLTIGRETRLPPGEVVRLAALYGRRRLSRVAAELVEYAAATDPDGQIAREVDEALAGHARPPTRVEPHAFLAEARRLLPPSLVAQIEATLEARPESGHSTVGWSPENG